MTTHEDMEVDADERNATNNNDEIEDGGKATPGVAQLPFARVKRIMKSDNDVATVSQETVFLVSKATELFVEFLAKEAYGKSKTDKRKTVQYKDVASTVSELEQLEFLSDIVPKQVPVRTIMASLKAGKKTKGAVTADGAEVDEPAVEREDEQ